jgi:hypothetical protein
MALAQQQYAIVLADQPLEKRSIEAMKESLKGLENSERIFKELVDLPKEQQTGYSVKHAQGRLAFSNSALRIIQRKIHETEVMERQKLERVQDMQEARKKLEIERDMKVLKEKEAKEAREAEIERKRKELLQKVKEETEKSLANQSNEKPKKRSREKDVEEEEHVKKR